jgi:DNA-binding IclR family transcriptional regulator
MRKSLNAVSMQDEADLRRVKEDDPFFSGTLAKGLLIMKCFVREPRAHANSELAARLGLSRPTVSRLCRTLHALGFLDHDERLDRYFIGPAAVTLAYPYIIKTPQLALVRPAMQALADRVKGAVSVGVTMDLDVVYLETCAYEEGTLKRPGVGAVNGVLETAMGRSWLAQLTTHERQEFFQRARELRPEQFARTHARAMDAVAGYARRGYAINLGDSGLGVLAVGVISKIHYGPRPLLFNCAVPGLRMSEKELHRTLGPELVQLVNFADSQMGLR